MNRLESRTGCGCLIDVLVPVQVVLPMGSVGFEVACDVFLTDASRQIPSSSGNVPFRKEDFILSTVIEVARAGLALYIYNQTGDARLGAITYLGIGAGHAMIARSAVLKFIHESFLP